MILDFMSDGEFPVTEFWDLEREMVGMVSFRLMLLMMVFVAVGGLADAVSGSHVHGSDVFTGPRTIRGYPTSPALAVTGT
jgi:hypothetical protein